MAIGDNTNPNLFGTNYNPADEALLAAQDAIMGSGESTQGSNGQQEEASAVNTGNVIMGGLPVLAASTLVANTTGFQPPAVTSTGGPPATTTVRGGAGARPMINVTGSVPNTTLPGSTASPRPPTPGLFSKLASNVVKGGVLTGLLTPNQMGKAEVLPTGSSATLFEDADGNISLVPKEGFLPMTGDMPSIAFMKADQEAETPAFTNKIEEIIAAKNARGPGAVYTQEELSAMNQFETDVREDTLQRQGDIASGQVELAKGIRELGTVTEDQKAVQDFMDERAELYGTTATDVITPFQEQAELTADLFTDPNTAIGQFVPRATFTLPDGTIIQEDEGGNRREISAEQLRQLEQDMAGLGQAQQSKTFSQEETIARLGGRTLNEYLNAPPVRTPGISGLKTDPQGRMIPNVGEFQPQPVAPQPVAPQPVAPQPVAPQAVAPQAPADQLSAFEQASLDRQLKIGGTGSFEGDSVLREAKLRANERQPGESQTERDTRVAQSRTTGSSAGGQLSQSDLRDLAQGTAKNATEGQRMRALEIQQKAGLGEFKPEQTELEKQYTEQRIAVMDKQLAQTGIVPSAPPVVDPKTGVITQTYTDGTTRYKGVTRGSGGSSSEFQNILGEISAGNTTNDSTSPDPVKINSPAEYDALAVGTPYIDSQGTPGIKK